MPNLPLVQANFFAQVWKVKKKFVTEIFEVLYSVKM